MKEKEQSLNIDTDVLAVHVYHYTLLAAYNVCMLVMGETFKLGEEGVVGGKCCSSPPN